MRCRRRSRLFGGYGQEFQSLSAQGSLFHGRLCSCCLGWGAYAAAEAGAPLQTVVDIAQQFAVFSPVER